MIYHVKPVAPVLAIAIDRQRRTLKRVKNHQRNQFLRKLIRAVVIGAICGKRRKPVGVVIGAHQMIRGSFRSRIRTVGRIRRGLTKPGALRLQGAIDFIGGNVQKPEALPRNGSQGLAIPARFFEQLECALNIRADELSRTMNRAVYMAFGGKMDDGTRGMSL